MGVCSGRGNGLSCSAARNALVLTFSSFVCPGCDCCDCTGGATVGSGGALAFWAGGELKLGGYLCAPRAHSLGAPPVSLRQTVSAELTGRQALGLRHTARAARRRRRHAAVRAGWWTHCHV
eukprot:5558252-Amphidinium_carterae.8